MLNLQGSLLPYHPESFVHQLLHKNITINIYRTVTLPVVVNVCETGSLTVRAERRLRVYENGVLGKNLGLGGRK